MRIDTADIRRWADEIRAIVGDDDPETFLDTLDGQTSAMEILGQLIIERMVAKTNEDAAKEVAATFAARAQRMANKQAAISRMMGEVLDAIGETKIPHPLGTVSRTKPRQSVEILDESEIPTQLMRVKRSPDVAAIKAQIEAGENVPGAILKTGEPGITVRIK